MPDALQIIAEWRAQEPVAWRIDGPDYEGGRLISGRPTAEQVAFVGRHADLTIERLYTRDPAALDALAAEVERLNLKLLSLEGATEDRTEAERLYREAEKLLTGDEQALRAEVERLTREPLPFDEAWPEIKAELPEHTRSGYTAADVEEAEKAAARTAWERYTAICAAKERSNGR